MTIGNTLNEYEVCLCDAEQFCEEAGIKFLSIFGSLEDKDWETLESQLSQIEELLQDSLDKVREVTYGLRNTGWEGEVWK